MRLAHGRELRVVGVVDQFRVLWQMGHGTAPALGDELELAVTVELVAEEVPEANRSRPQASHELRESRLVHLEQAQVCVARAEQRGGDTGNEIRSSRVVGELVPRPEDLCHHRGRGRLAVGGRQDGGPVGESRGEAVDGAAVELGEEFPGDRGAATNSDSSRECCNAACKRDLEREWGAGAHPASLVKPCLRGTTCGFLNLLYTY